MEEEMITISKEEYQKLLADSAFLGALHAAGVDSWSGYDMATEIYLENV